MAARVSAAALGVTQISQSLHGFHPEAMTDSFTTEQFSVNGFAAFHHQQVRSRDSSDDIFDSVWIACCERLTGSQRWHPVWFQSTNRVLQRVANVVVGGQFECFQSDLSGFRCFEKATCADWLPAEHADADQRQQLAVSRVLSEWHGDCNTERARQRLLRDGQETPELVPAMEVEQHRGAVVPKVPPATGAHNRLQTNRDC